MGRPAFHLASTPESYRTVRLSEGQGEAAGRPAGRPHWPGTRVLKGRLPLDQQLPKQAERPHLGGGCVQRNTCSPGGPRRGEGDWGPDTSHGAPAVCRGPSFTCP